MYIQPHDVEHEFPEYKQTLQEMKSQDAHLAELIEEYEQLNAEIVDIGPVRGTAPITLKDILFDETKETSDVRGFRVRKRGITSLLTEGIVTALNGTFGPAQDPDQDTERVFLRDQIVIRPMERSPLVPRVRHRKLEPWLTSKGASPAKPKGASMPKSNGPSSRPTAAAGEAPTT